MGRESEAGVKVMLVHYNPAEPGQAGGAESAVRDLAEGLRRLGHEVRTEFMDPMRGYSQCKPDVVHFHTVHVGMGLGVLQWAQTRGIPHCLSLHDYWPWCGPRMLLVQDDHSCSAVSGVCDNACGGKAPPETLDIVNGSPVVAFNRYSAEIYRRHGVRVDAVIGHGIDVNYFSPAPEEREDGRIVTVSAWPEYPTKGMHVLRAALRSLGANAALVAHVPREVVRRELRRGDVFVFPSCYEETWGLCLTEAMACGLACVASDVCGPREQLTGEPPRGVLVPPRDPEALAAALRTLLTEPGLRRDYGAAARLWAERNATLEGMAARYVAFYEKVIHGS